MKNFFIKLIAIVVSVFLLSLVVPPLLQVGNNTYNDYENINYNGYFSLENENKILNLGSGVYDNIIFGYGYEFIGEFGIIINHNISEWYIYDVWFIDWDGMSYPMFGSILINYDYILEFFSITFIFDNDPYGENTYIKSGDNETLIDLVILGVSNYE